MKLAYKRKKNLFSNQNGQTLLFVVVAVTIALAVGVSVSTRNLSSSSRISRSDTSAKVIAASEAGLERLLVLPTNNLDELAKASPNCLGISSDFKTDSDGRCYLEFGTGSEIKTRAKFFVEKFRLNSPEEAGSSYYWFDLGAGYVKEVVLESPECVNGGGSCDRYEQNQIRICWDNPDALIYYISYDVGRPSSQDYVVKGGVTASSSGNFSGFESADNSNVSEFSKCKNISIKSSSSMVPYGVRLKAYNIDSSVKIGVFPLNGDELPFQGYKLVSKGILASQNEVVETREYTVYKSYTYLPSFFDFGIYAGDGINLN